MMHQGVTVLHTDLKHQADGGPEEATGFSD
jgi:hypothetical protein